MVELRDDLLPAVLGLGVRKLELVRDEHESGPIVIRHIHLTGRRQKRAVKDQQLGQSNYLFFLIKKKEKRLLSLSHKQRGLKALCFGWFVHPIVVTTIFHEHSLKFAGCTKAQS